MDRLTAAMETARSFVEARLVDMVLGASLVAALALLLSLLALRGRGKLASRLAEVQVALAAMETAEGRRIARDISQRSRDSGA